MIPSGLYSPALASVLVDDRLSPRAKRVYTHVAGILDFNEFRPVKLVIVAAALDIRRDHVATELGLMVQLGYLRRGDRAWAGGPYVYQLVWSLRRPEHDRGDDQVA